MLRHVTVTLVFDVEDENVDSYGDFDQILYRKIENAMSKGEEGLEEHNMDMDWMCHNM